MGLKQLLRAAFSPFLAPSASGGYHSHADQPTLHLEAPPALWEGTEREHVIADP